MKVLEGTSPVELLAVPDWLVDEPELHKRGVVPAECLKPVSIMSVVPGPSSSLSVILVNGILHELVQEPAVRRQGRWRE